MWIETTGKVLHIYHRFRRNHTKLTTIIRPTIKQIKKTNKQTTGKRLNAVWSPRRGVFCFYQRPLLCRLRAVRFRYSLIVTPPEHTPRRKNGHRTFCNKCTQLRRKKCNDIVIRLKNNMFCGIGLRPSVGLNRMFVQRYFRVVCFERITITSPIPFRSA